MFMKLITPIILHKGQAVTSLADPAVFGDGDAVNLAQHYSNTGSDVLMIFDQSEGDEEHDISLTLMRQMVRLSDVPMWGAGNVKRVEDVKKILYAGCKKAILNYSKASNMEILEEVSKRFGREKLAVCVKDDPAEEICDQMLQKIVQYASELVILTDDCVKAISAVSAYEKQIAALEADAGKEASAVDGADSKASKKDAEESAFGLNLIILSADSPFAAGGQAGAGDTAAASEGSNACEMNHVSSGTDACAGMNESEVPGAYAAYAGITADGIGGAFTQDLSADLMGMKAKLKEAGFTVNLFESAYAWDDVKTGENGLVPVVVQDYRNEEVLMVAYMNREAFEQTIRTGVMTYWSRSRSELWVKGLTSGHYQYLKELRIDCDNDTLLARVSQIGAACHTGNRSCFYRTALKKDTPQRNPMKVFEDVYGTIEDRRIHPKEGSYTNYLFNKGIDKILKKCGEEATEIVIAAKNPNPEEVKYEMADFLYHMMVLMSERGITWDDIAQELANRE